MLLMIYIFKTEKCLNICLVKKKINKSLCFSFLKCSFVIFPSSVYDGYKVQLHITALAFSQSHLKQSISNGGLALAWGKVSFVLCSPSARPGFLMK